MLRAAFFAILVTGASVAMAQTDPQLTEARMKMATAMSHLGAQQQTTILVTGEERQGSRRTPLASRLSVYRGLLEGEPTIWLELVVQKNGVTQQRLVADGQRLWNYNGPNNTYSVWSYREGTSDPARTLLMSLKKLTSNEENILAQTMLEAQETVSAGSFYLESRWLPWMPTATVSNPGSAIVAESSTPNSRKLTYLLAEPMPGAWQFNGYEYLQTRSVAGVPTITELTASVQHDTLSTDTSFVFNPGNARPISVSQSQRG